MAGGICTLVPATRTLNASGPRLLPSS